MPYAPRVSFPPAPTSSLESQRLFPHFTDEIRKPRLRRPQPLTRVPSQFPGWAGSKVQLPPGNLAAYPLSLPCTSSQEHLAPAKHRSLCSELFRASPYMSRSWELRDAQRCFNRDLGFLPLFAMDS